MLKIILKLIGLVFILIGVIMIYDARILTEKFFSFGDQNEASTGFKILGFTLFIIGGLIMTFS